jgi:aspartate ammonia-lyase
MRVETDFLGSVEVPADALYGAQTARAVENFRISGVTLLDRPELLDALVFIKIAAARANIELGALDETIGSAIIAAGREILAGRWREQFPIDIVQGGGGTATNMNVNEVLANLAGERLGVRRGTYDRVHPNDHVNRSQSTNDVYPTALALAALTAGSKTYEGLCYVANALDKKAEEFGGAERIGRTCLQDALPVPVDATHRGQANAVRRTGEGLRLALAELRAVPLGATAVGTGLGAPEGYRALAVACLSEETGIDLTCAPDLFDSLAHLDPMLAVTDALRRVSLVLAQTAQDFRFLSSGPVGGIGELALPAVQVGSSMMPGKVNPVIPELVLQVSFEVRGACHTIEAAVAAGELELNAMEPVVARHLLESLVAVDRVARVFADRCVARLRWNRDVVDGHLDGSYAVAVELANDVGYRAALGSLGLDERLGTRDE